MNSPTSAGISNIQDALAYFGVTETTLSSEEKQSLDEKGYIIFPGLADKAWVDQLRETFARLVQEEGAKAGAEFNQEEGACRLADLVNKGEVLDGVYTHPKVLAAAYHVIGTEFKIMSLNGRDALAGTGHQDLHADWKSRELNEPYHICNSVWLLDDMNRDNGATRLVPGTHHLAGRPADYITDVRAEHPQQVLFEAGAGSVLVFNSHTWHGGTQNTSGLHRRVLHSAYVAREYPQQLNQQKFIQKVTWDRISPAARYILDVYEPLQA
jgi:ectoine hydroxylase-related dioxygenase (phytanoyl-CoA dioxygenase family)